VPTERSRDLFGFEALEGRQVVAAFDGGQVTSDAGALLLGAVNRAIGLVRRLAGCFADGRMQELVEHGVETMLMQRICGTIRLKLLKIGALVRISVRRIKVAMLAAPRRPLRSSLGAKQAACPYQDEYQLAYRDVKRAAF
jgi:IS5 family transposase